jgi:hypothetical protein
VKELLQQQQQFLPVIVEVTGCKLSWTLRRGSCAASDESSDYAYKSDEDNDQRYGMATDMEL